jgi:hypothetical protein
MPDRRAVMGLPCLLVPGFSIKKGRMDGRVSELVERALRGDRRLDLPPLVLLLLSTWCCSVRL